MRFVLYARASTKDKQHPDHQLAELRTEAARRGWASVAEFVELESGKRDDRPQWAQAVDLVLTGKADGIVSTELSRWGRSLRHLTEVSAAFQLAGKHLVCTRQPIDTTTPVGRLVFHMLGAVAEFEADLTRERVKAGVAFARDRMLKRGRTWGRQAEVIPPATLRQAMELRAAGLSWRRVSARLFSGGHAQPARKGPLRERPPRPWPIGTLRDALVSVELPPEKGAPNPASGAG